MGIFALALALILSGCLPPDPTQKIDQIKTAATALLNDLGLLKADLAVAKPDLNQDRTLINDAITQAAKIPPASAVISEDTKKWMDDDAAIRKSWGYRLEEWVTGSIWVMIGLGIAGVILCVVFPAITPLLMNLEGGFGGVVSFAVQHLSALLPLQNLKFLTTWIEGLKIRAIPVSQRVLPKPTTDVTVTASAMPSEKVPSAGT